MLEHIMGYFGTYTPAADGAIATFQFEYLTTLGFAAIVIFLAQIMFFNGTSETPDGPIEYLANPCRKENLAFSFQMKWNADQIYPGFMRTIYLKGLRYNLHLRPRSALIEVGAQTNTYEEAVNAMDPLAQLLDQVLTG